jgi:succinate dehydrogenase hydrophobic anchor subunit
MTSWRQLFASVVLVLLAAGYFGSQAATLAGEASVWAQRVDQAPVRMLALVVLIASIALSFGRERSP